MTNSKSDSKHELDEVASRFSKSVVDVVRDRIMDMSDELIFHYCSGETLLLILKNKTIRFGDAGCMNDGEEVIWSLRQFEKAVQRLHDRDDIPEDVPPVPKKFIDKFKNEWDNKFQSSRHFLSSFSLSGDSLSQWRAYADDAQGFSIGFCVDEIDIPARFVRVEYDVEVQQNEIIGMLSALYQESKRDEKYFENQGINDISFIFGIASAYKNPAFVDEREIRGSHTVGLKDSSVGGRQFEFLGGHIGDKSILDGNVEYRAVKGRLVPYIDFPFQLGDICPVKELWLGPRCASPEEDVSIFLQTIGYGHVVIKRAGSKYR